MNGSTQHGSVEPRGFFSKATLREKAIVVLGILYILSPVDFIPEAILGPFGLLDDTGGAILVIKTIMSVRERP